MPSPQPLSPKAVVSWFEIIRLGSEACEDERLQGKDQLCARACGFLQTCLLLDQLPDLQLVRQLIVPHLLERCESLGQLNALDALELRRLGRLAFALLSQLGITLWGLGCTCRREGVSSSSKNGMGEV